MLTNATTNKLKIMKFASLVSLNILLLHNTKNSVKTTTAAMSTSSKVKTIDSHLHIWANKTEEKKYPYASTDQIPPGSLQDRASASYLLETMKNSNVDGALIVQPINHKFDHSYVASAIKEYPTKFKGMLLHDPSLSAGDAVKRLEELVLQGFVGVRFNPYLWSAGSFMSQDDGSGIAVYKRCSELKIPVGIMCFKGLDLHYDDIIQLLEKSPETILVLDHFAFTKLDEKGDECFQKLLSLSKYPSVHVKISAFFRLSDNDGYPYEKLRAERFVPLLEAFGSNRLMFGSDFPFVLEQEEGYGRTVDLVQSWCATSDDKKSLMSGTAERIFGVWG